MVCVNEFYKAEKLPKSMLVGLCKLLAPICPHIAQECYSLIGEEGLIDYASWPVYDESKVNDRPVTYAIQINGKLRSTIDFKKDANEEELEELKKLVLEDERVKLNVDGKTIVKMIVVKNKIVSIVVR